MHARRLMTFILMTFLGLIGLGLAAADDPRPASTPPDRPLVPGAQTSTGQGTPRSPAVATPPSMPAGPTIQNKHTAPLEQQLREYGQTLRAGERQVLVEAVCAEVPADFCAECGLLEKTQDTSTTLSRREAALLKALLRGTVCNTLLVYQPFSQNLLSNGQPQLFQAVGATVLPAGTSEPNDQKPLRTTESLKPVVALTTIHSLRVTPKLSEQESNELLLRLEFQALRPGAAVTLNRLTAEPDGSTRPAGALLPSFNVETVQTSFKLAFGETVVFGTGNASSVDASKRMEVLWVLTPHEVRGKQ